MLISFPFLIHHTDSLCLAQRAPFFWGRLVQHNTSVRCRELSKDARVSGKLDANEYLETVAIPTELPIADPNTDAELQVNLLQDYERKFEQLPEDRKLSKMCRDACLKTFEKG